MSDAAFDALALIVVALIGLVGTIITIHARRQGSDDGGGDVPSVTEKQVREAEDPGVLALRIAIDTRKDLEATRGELATAKTELAGLARQNRRLREVLREVVERMERIAAWVRAGHQPPPPFTAEQISQYILDSIPDLHDGGDDA